MFCIATVVWFPHIDVFYFCVVVGHAKTRKKSNTYKSQLGYIYTNGGHGSETTNKSGFTIKWMQIYTYIFKSITTLMKQTKKYAVLFRKKYFECNFTLHIFQAHFEGFADLIA